MTAVFDTEGRFLGHEPRECGEHRTVGEHRAWCYECHEWCSPGAPCVRCDLFGHVPRRGSDVERWIKLARDRIKDETPLGAEMKGWDVLNNLLDAYRVHADTGTPLIEGLTE